jgi:hypothetical protein
MRLWLPRSDPYPDPLLMTPIPHRVELLRPRRRWRGRRNPVRCEWRRICRPRRPPHWRRRGRFALVGPDIARPVRVALRRTGHAMCPHGRVAFRRTDCRRRDRYSRQRHQRDRNSGGQTANEARHRTTSPAGPVPTLGCISLCPPPRGGLCRLETSVARLLF